MAASLKNAGNKDSEAQHKRKDSMVAEDGTYVPGAMHRVRQKNNEAAYEKRPSLRDAIEEHDASRLFRDNFASLLFDEPLDNGFRARFACETLHFDARRDGTLRKFVRRLGKFLKEKGLFIDDSKERMFERVAQSSLFVSDALGGEYYKDLKKRLTGRFRDPPADTLIGRMLGGKFLQQRNGLRRRGVGICRHRALLFKYCCDALGITECAVFNGVFMPDLRQQAQSTNVVEYRKKVATPDHMWNVVRIGGESFIVDCMALPGELLSNDDDFSASYHRANGRSGLRSVVFHDAEVLSSVASSGDEDERDQEVEEEDNGDDDDEGNEAKREKVEDKSCTFLEVYSSTMRRRCEDGRSDDGVIACGGWAPAVDCELVQHRDGEERVSVTFEIPDVGLCRKLLRPTSRNLRFGHSSADDV